MGQGITFGSENKSSSPFKVESGSADALVISSIIDEEFADGYEPIGLTCDSNDICFILFKKIGI